MAAGTGSAPIMSTGVQDRLGAMIGLVVTGSFATWWLGNSMLALEQGLDTTAAAAAALQGLLVARAMVLSPFALRLGASRGWRRATAHTAALVAAPWPLLLLAWSASSVPARDAMMAEIVLLACGGALAVAGSGLRRLLRSLDAAAMLGTTLGAALGAGLWYTRSQWSTLLS